MAPPIRATFGQRGFSSSESAALTSSLVSNLRARMDSPGSILFTLTWKVRTTPSGRSIFALRASRRRTSDSDCTSWPTARAEDSESTGAHRGMPDTLTSATRLASWVSPKAGDAECGVESAEARAARTKSPGPRLNEMASWATPNQRDFKSEQSSEAFERERWEHARGKSLSAEAAIAGWPTPMAGTLETETYNAAGDTMNGRKTRLLIAPWATPVATEIGNTPENYAAMKRNAKSGPRTAVTHPSLQAQLVTGMTSSGSPVGTASGGQLNPRFSAWLQGFPIIWDICAMRIRLPRRSRRSSVAP